MILSRGFSYITLHFMFNDDIDLLIDFVSEKLTQYISCFKRLENDWFVLRAFMININESSVNSSKSSFIICILNINIKLVWSFH